MKSITKYLLDIELPKMIRVRQGFDAAELENPAEELLRQLAAEGVATRVRPGMRVGITAGSRGIDNMPLCLRTLCDWVKSLGGRPFIIPAMGSHGGATAEGQRQMLAGYGITEESMGAPILDSMETVQIATTEDGTPCYMAKTALEADAIILCNRIKPHTTFRHTYESGLVKMSVIGLGKHAGASAAHAGGWESFGPTMEAISHKIFATGKIIFGVALLDNAFEKTRGIAVIKAEEIHDREPEYLKEAFANMGKLNFPHCDILVVDQIGKNISGGGADPNITGLTQGGYCTSNITTNHMVVLDLTAETHGSGVGLAKAAATTERVMSKYDPEATVINYLTSTAVFMMPHPFENDRAAIQAVMRTGYDVKSVKMIRIKNTLDIHEIWISEALWNDVKDDPYFTPLGQLETFAFDRDGNLF